MFIDLFNSNVLSSYKRGVYSAVKCSLVSLGCKYIKGEYICTIMQYRVLGKRGRKSQFRATSGTGQVLLESDYCIKVLVPV